MPRLFIAIDLPRHIKELLAPMCCGLPGARWLPPEQLHLTVRFIGDVDGGVFHDILEVLSDIQFAAFTLHLQGIGFFPPRGKPRILWVGVAKSDELFRLQKKIESALVSSGLEPEGRKYSPHITLARLKNTPVPKAGRYLTHHSLFASSSFPVEDFALYSSVLNERGAKHYIEETYPLS